MLLGRGYKAGDIRQAIEFGVKMNREETIEKVVREDNKNRNRVRYTITYDPKLLHHPGILNKKWNVMVDSDRRLNKAFPAPPMAEEGTQPAGQADQGEGQGGWSRVQGMQGREEEL